MRISKTSMVPILAGVALLLAACGGSDGDLTAGDEPSVLAESPVVAEEDAAGHGDEAHGDEAHGDEAHGDEAKTDGHGADGHAAFGEPAAAKNADRVVTIKALDTLAFDPADIHVHAGETITFRIVGAKALHDFTIGDQAAQTAHAEAMRAMGGAMEHHDDGNAVLVPSGETVSLTWKFTKAGTFLYGCHQPGHYDGGMVGKIVVDA